MGEGNAKRRTVVVYSLLKMSLVNEQFAMEINTTMRFLQEIHLQVVDFFHCNVSY